MRNVLVWKIILFVLLSSICSSGQQKSFINYSFQENSVMRSKLSNVKLNMFIGKTVVGVSRSSERIITAKHIYNLSAQRTTSNEAAKENPLPTEYSLDQNYPNPFNPVTRIKYSVPKESFITLAIYNMLGEKVEELVSETKSAGTYFVDWDAKGFTSGIYIYNLRSQNYSASRKLILLK